MKMHTRILDQLKLVRFIVASINKQTMWTENNNKLYQKFTFNDFIEAFGFMSKVALVSEKINHHPTWTNCWNVVEIWLSTHDAGNIITDKDRQLAVFIEEIYHNKLDATKL